MTSQRDLKVAILIMIIFFITGIICYASFTPPAPEEPVRLMFQNKAGKVLFTHSVHTGDYTEDCLDCHHNIEDDETYNCSECHEETGDEDLLSRADAFHAQCQGCHEDVGAGPVECNTCHSL
ncbi:MAG: cytochrome c family protein [Desulfobacterales bacterium]|nr:cytochrome c family protein [Desulfobacterales bacterium]MBU8910397.1 cytochrome c family protein [Desulfobacterales bacterium]